MARPSPRKGSHTYCYFNPVRPDEAVISRDVPRIPFPDVLVVVFALVVFTLASLVLVTSMFRTSTRKSAALTPEQVEKVVKKI